MIREIKSRVFYIILIHYKKKIMDSNTYLENPKNTKKNPNN